MIAVAVPVVAATVVVILFIAVETTGGTLSTIRLANVAEAAGMGLGGETLRRAMLGEDPSRMLHVRPEIISSAITEVTALEAAVLSRKIELVRMLDRRGFISHPETRRGLACLAADVDARDIAQFLTRPDDPPCAPGAARARVVARSKVS